MSPQSQNTLLAALLVAIACAIPAFAQDPIAPAKPPVETPAVSTPIPAPGLREELAIIQQDPIFTQAVAGVHVLDLTTSEVMMAANDTKGLIPASVMKMLTAATALKTLGPAYRFPTWIMTDGTIERDTTGGGALKGSLYIKGQGDPTMVVERMWRMIRTLKNMGITEIKGDVIFDDGYFSDSTLIPGWFSDEDMKDGPTYFAPLGALSLNYNVATLILRPGPAVGAAAVAISDTPTSVVVIDNALTTARAGGRIRLNLEREMDPTGKIVTFHLAGSIPLDAAPEKVYKSLADPLGNYISGFTALAAEQGLKVKGRYKVGSTPKSASLLFKEESDPLLNILAEMNKHSNNFMAEQILRGIGAEVKGLPGTTAKGVQVVNEYLAALGIPSTDFHLINGSGLSRDIKVRPSTITRMLSGIYQDPGLGPEFLATLSVAGRDGTLWSRFRGEENMEGRMRGKTGTLNGVHCLAGYVRGTNNHMYAFSFLVNDINGAASRARAGHDRLVRALVGTPANVAAVEPAPINP
jgi:D-alanyl-D-alanine carboxypeptidase/D-alanyl-D-alanine-endopeptidase (penicillin-binding protein 4)